MQQIDFETISNLLQKNGFSNYEAEVYLAILKLKKSNGIQISEAVNADKTTVYRAIYKLLKLGLIASTGDKYNNLLFVKDINKLQSLLENKLSELNQGIELLGLFIDQYPTLENDALLKSKMTLLKGEDAVKAIYDIRHENPNTLIREITTERVFNKMGIDRKASWDTHAYWDKIIAQRKKAGCFLHQIVENEDSSIIYHRTNKEQFKEVRVVPEDFKITAGINIFGNKVGIFNTKSKDIIAVIIDDAMIAGLCANMFDFIWKRSKQI
jgi:predicted transcriptional regulator